MSAGASPNVLLSRARLLIALGLVLSIPFAWLVLRSRETRRPALANAAGSSARASNARGRPMTSPATGPRRPRSMPGATAGAAGARRDEPSRTLTAAMPRTRAVDSELRPMPEPRPDPAPSQAERPYLVATAPSGATASDHAETRLRATLQSMRADKPEMGLAFARCSSVDCVARLESRSPAEIDRFVAELKRSSLAARVRVRERLTAFNGRMFQADVSAPIEAISPQTSQTSEP